MATDKIKRGASNFTALLVVLAVAGIGTVALKVSSAYTNRLWFNTAPTSRTTSIQRPTINIPSGGTTYTSTQTGSTGSSSSSSSSSTSSGSVSTCSANGVTIKAYNGDTCSIESINGNVTCKVNGNIVPCQ